MRPRPRFRRADLFVLVIVAAATGMLAAFTPWPGSPKPPLPPIGVTVYASAPGRAIPGDFLGLSTEFAAVLQYAGSDRARINPLFVRLARQLSPGGGLSFRVGGDSTDSSWWPEPGIQRPPGIHYRLDQHWLGVAAAVTRALDARLILGANLEANDVEIALAEAHAFNAGLPAHTIQALELGNEPGLYSRFPYYHTATGRAVMGRPRGYGYAAFVDDFNRFSATLLGNPLAGPGVANSPWLQHLGTFLSTEPQVKLVTLHRYPLQRCYTRPGSPAYPTFGNLLAARATDGIAEVAGRYARVAHAHGLPLRIDELNTISCGPDRAISQSFASALWALKALFALAGAGVDGVNLHTFPGAGYELFRFGRSAGRWRAYVSPEYYGLLTFVRAAPAGARLIPVRQRASTSVAAWATRSPGGAIRIVVVNQGSEARRVVIRLAGSATGGAGTAPGATLEQLLAPGLRSTGGTTLAGQSFATPTTTARLQGARSEAQLQATGGAYALEVPAASAALLRIGRAGG
jgi:hypothetical protein